MESAMDIWQAGDQQTACDWEHVDASRLHRLVACNDGPWHCSAPCLLHACRPGTLGFVAACCLPIFFEMAVALSNTMPFYVLDQDMVVIMM